MNFQARANFVVCPEMPPYDQREAVLTKSEEGDHDR
jgi:hypothetical protein